MSETPVRTRFAPSPSGNLHIGGARTALFCWAYAHGRDGQFILRIEDTDQKRSSDAASLGFLADLAWLGIGWDEGPEHDGNGGGDRGPYYQSKRLDLYDRHIEQLIENGHAYRAYETPEELAAARDAARAAGTSYRYDRASLSLDDTTRARYDAEDRPHVVRLRVPDEATVTIHDAVRGDVSVQTTELDDFVIRKADGFPTYHFAVVVDDECMGVTHVIRGQEHLNNTIKHALIQDALGFGRPAYAHISLIMNPDGSKMSKRDKDKFLRRHVRENTIESTDVIDADRWSWWLAKKDHQLDLDEAERLAEALGVSLPEINVDDFRRAGYLPEVLINYLALLGWSPGGDVEKFDRAFLLERFDLDRVIKSEARFDRDKLLAFNLDALQNLDVTDFTARLRAHGDAFHPAFMARIGEHFDLFAACNQGRSKTLEDPFRDLFFVLPDDAIEYEQSKAVRKAMQKGEPTGYDHLDAVRPVMAGIDDWTPAAIETAVAGYAETAADGKLGKVAQPLRIAVTGGTISPAIFETLAILGQPTVLARIERCLERRDQA